MGVYIHCHSFVNNLLNSVVPRGLFTHLSLVKAKLQRRRDLNFIFSRIKASRLEKSLLVYKVHNIQNVKAPCQVSEKDSAVALYLPKKYLSRLSKAFSLRFYNSFSLFVIFSSCCLCPRSYV